MNLHGRLTFISLLISGIHCHEIVAYWGQNGVSNSVTEVFRYEQSLRYYCSKMPYDVIILAFLNVFFNKDNKDDFPSINLSWHCEETFDEYPALIHCPKQAEDIIECQRQNKKILISLGGAIGEYGFKSAQEAELLAQRLWDLLLGGDSNTRPFDNAILDGVDLNIENGRSEYYTEFVKKMRSLMNTDKTKKYLITAAPQCPFPDKSLGPGPVGTALTDIGKEFDHIYVQFYNNPCHMKAGVHFNIKKWFDYAKSVKETEGKGPKILYGLPAGERASGHPLYHPPISKVKQMYKQDMSKSNYFGGFMLWDAGFDGNNLENGLSYSTRLSKIINRTAPTSTISPVTKWSTTTTTTTTPPPTTQSSKSMLPTVTTNPTTTKTDGNSESKKQVDSKITADCSDDMKLVKLLIFVSIGMLVVLIILVLVIIFLIYKFLNMRKTYVLKHDNKKDGKPTDDGMYSDIGELAHEIKYYQQSIKSN